MKRYMRIYDEPYERCELIVLGVLFGVLLGLVYINAFFR